MLFSVITVSYNSASTIKKTVDSVLSQQMSDFEFIIVDGCSTDNTTEVVRSYTDKRIKFLSEPDNGLYDAMNKGLTFASGKYIAILNSDDVYVDSSVLMDVAKRFEESQAEVVAGDLYYFKNDVKKKTRRYNCGEYKSKKQWKAGWHPPHPSTFFAKSVYERYGNFDVTFPIAADYDFMFRTLYINNCSFAKIPRALVAMREGGESTRNLNSYFRANCEVLKVWKKYHLTLPMFFIIRKIFCKLLFHV